MLGQRAPACGYLILWGEAPSYTLYLFALFSLTLSLSVSSTPPSPTVTPWSTLRYWDTPAATYVTYIAALDQQTQHANRWKEAVDLSVYACSGERGAININHVTAHQLMFITYHTQHLKRETTFHLCLEQRLLQKLSQLRWSLIKLRRFIWLSGLFGRRGSQHSLSVGSAAFLG